MASEKLIEALKKHMRHVENADERPVVDFEQTAWWLNEYRLVSDRQNTSEVVFSAVKEELLQYFQEDKTNVMFSFAGPSFAVAIAAFFADRVFVFDIENNGNVTSPYAEEAKKDCSAPVVFSLSNKTGINLAGGVMLVRNLGYEPAHVITLLDHEQKLDERAASVLDDGRYVQSFTRITTLSALGINTISGGASLSAGGGGLG